MEIDMHSLSENVKELWNAWELRTLMLLSLFLQILLVIFGNRRKYIAGRLVGVFIWLAYLSADWVATFSLGILARSKGDSETISTNPKHIPLFWAPALLVHLGGPDTITAYSIEDNELWLRHLLELVTQVSIAFYVLLRLWSKSTLPFVAIPIFVVGVIKYGERIFVLWLASSKKFRASAMDQLYKGHRSLGRFADLYGRMRDAEIIDLRFVFEAKFLHEAHFLFRMFKVLSANLHVYTPYFKTSFEIIQKKSAIEAFKLIEIELGFVYDVLYTKLTNVGFRRIFLRGISFVSTVSAFLAFRMTISKHEDHSKIDTAMSYVLLVGAIVLEIYSIIVLVFSDWTMLWFSLPNKTCAKCFYRAIWSSRLRSLFNNHNKRWSRSMAQHDLIGVHFTENRWNNFLKDLLDNSSVQTREEVSIGLKKSIYHQLLGKCSRYYHESDDLKLLLAERGDGVLRRTNCFEMLGWSVSRLEFHHSLIAWHIATSICFLDEFHRISKRYGGGGGALDTSCIMSKSLSNYMMYLLVDCPFMLPKGVSETRYRSTRIKTMDLISQAWGSPCLSESKTIWDAFYELVREYPDAEAELDISALSGGCKLVKLIISLETQNNWSNEQKWEMISEVWVEILIYAAVQCGWKEHAQALARGGELLTHVSLLMAHLGLSEQCLLDKQNFQSKDFNLSNQMATQA